MFNISWFLLAIATGVFFGLQSVVIKIVSKRYHHLQILTWLFVIAGLLLLPIGLSAQWEIDLNPFILSTATSFVINLIAYYLLTRAIRISPISLVMPFVGLTPLFLTISSYIILGETITMIGLIGILSIVIGGFILQLPVPDESQAGGIKVWRRLINTSEKGIGYVILVAFLWSITASVEKIAVLSSAPEIYALIIHLALGVGFLFMYRFMIKKNKASHERAGENASNEMDKANSRTIKQHYVLLIVLGLISAALALCQLTAIKMTMVTYVIAFKRAGVLVSSLFGFFYFKEGGVLKSLVGTLLILVGATIITI